MATAKKNPITNKWNIQIRYKDSFGNNKKTTRRGFDTKKEAERAAYDFIKKQEKDFNMLFSDFIDIYMDDMKSRLKENTVRTKHFIIEEKHPGHYLALRARDELNEELIRMDKELNQRYETLVEQYKVSKNITEELKEQDQMRWVQGMNNIRVMVEEMLINEIMTI